MIPVRVHISHLTRGNPLPAEHLPVCCHTLMDRYQNGYTCSQCDNYVNHDHNRTIVHNSTH